MPMDLTSLLTGVSEAAVRSAAAVSLAIAPVPADQMSDALRACGQRADHDTFYAGQLVEGFRSDQTYREEGEGASKRYFVEVGASFGEPVVRYDYVNRRSYVEVLSLADGAVDLSRLNGKAPWLTDHWSYDIERSNKGRCIQAELRTDNDGRRFIWTRVELSRTASNADYRQNVQDGIFFGASIGYRYNLDDVDMTQSAEGVWVYTIKRWSPYEVSNVSIPAGALSGLRSAAFSTTRQQRNDAMPQPANNDGTTVENRAADEAALRTATETASRDATTAERQRIADINDLGTALGLDPAVTRTAITEGTAFTEFARTARKETNDAQRDALQNDGQRNVAQPTAIQRDSNFKSEMEARMDAYVANALGLRPGARADAGTNTRKENAILRSIGDISADARNFMDQTPSEIARAMAYHRNDSDVLRMRASRAIQHAMENYTGGATGQRLGHSTSDFPGFMGLSYNGVVGAALQRIVLASYEGEREDLNYADFTFRVPASSMNQMDLLYKGAFYGIEGIPEWGNLPEMDRAEHSASLRAEKRGGRFGVSLEMIINDNFGLLDGTAADMGTAAAYDEQEIAELALKSGMRLDSKKGVRASIYSKANGTEIDGGVLDDKGRILDRMMLALKAQTEPGVDPKKARRLGHRPRKLAYSPDLAAQIARLNAMIQADATGNINIHQAKYDLVELLHADNGTLYMMDDPNKAKIVGMVRVAGWEGIQVRPVAVSDGLHAEWMVLNIVGAGVVKERGIVKAKVTLPAEDEEA